MRITDVLDAGREILRLLKDYRGDGWSKRELRLDPAVYGYLQGRFGKMTRQHWVRMHSRPRPQRIDFRHGGNNPVVFEFAVRPPSGAGELYGSQNRAELRKLTRVVPSQARLRVLLLLDLAPVAIAKSRLKATFDVQNSGQGNFPRHAVRVAYVHEQTRYQFLWRP